MVKSNTNASVQCKLAPNTSRLKHGQRNDTVLLRPMTCRCRPDQRLVAQALARSRHLSRRDDSKVNFLLAQLFAQFFTGVADNIHLYLGIELGKPVECLRQ